MLPTTYPGDATINGEKIPAELELSTDSVRLTIERGQEIISWPIDGLDVEASRDGGYELALGSDSFQFKPSVDDGLSDEIALRRRFSTPPGSIEPDIQAPESSALGPTAPKGTGSSIADRVRSAGHHSRPADTWLTGSIPIKAVVLGVGGVLLLVILGLLVFSLLGSGAEPASQAPPTEVPEVTVAPTNAPPASAEPAPDVAPVTVTQPLATEPPATVAPEPRVLAAFGLDPAGVAAAWDALSADAFPGESLVDLGREDSVHRFGFGEYVTLELLLGDDGLVDRFTLLGDPSGQVEDQREVIGSLGIALSVVEPRLTPVGRRELLESLGFDINDPELDGLNGTVTLEGVAYLLRWDAEAGRIVLSAVEAELEG